MIDAGFLEYARLGLLPTDDADIVRSLAVVDATIRRTTDTGDGFLRYNGDGYGDGAARRPPVGAVEQGQRPPLAGPRRRARPVRARHRRHRARRVARLQAMRDMGSGVGLIPEQAWELPDLARSPFGTDPTIASIGFVNGKPAGSASALTWSAGQFVRLMLDSRRGDVLDRPAYTTDRYVRHTPGRDDADGDRAGRPHVGRRLGDGRPARRRPATRSSIAATNPDDNTSTTTHAATAGRGRLVQRPRPARPAARPCSTSSRRARPARPAREVRTVVFDRAPGTLLFDGRRPGRRRQRPGQLRLPDGPATSTPGAYDLQQFEVYDAGDDGHLPRAHARPHADVRQPARRAAGRRLRPRPGRDARPRPPRRSRSATTRSRAAARGAGCSRSRASASGSSTPAATTLGTITIRANAISRYITFSVPQGRARRHAGVRAGASRSC